MLCQGKGGMAQWYHQYAKVSQVKAKYGMFIGQ